MPRHADEHPALIRLARPEQGPRLALLDAGAEHLHRLGIALALQVPVALVDERELAEAADVREVRAGEIDLQRAVAELRRARPPGVADALGQHIARRVAGDGVVDENDSTATPEASV